MAKRQKVEGVSASCSAMAHASEAPSRLEVPRPSSSTSSRLGGPRFFMMYVVSRISHAKVEPFVSIESAAPMRVKTRESSGSVAASAGTWQPTCAISTTSAHCRR